MSVSTLLKRVKRKPGAPSRAAERPASATASAAFWRAFLGQDARPVSAYGPAGTSGAVSRGDKTATPGASGMRADAVPSTEPAAIARELALSRFASVRSLQRLRREFALKNHPDRVASGLRAGATKRMMIANALIDSAVKRFSVASGRDGGETPAEGGNHI